MKKIYSLLVLTLYGLQSLSQGTWHITNGASIKTAGNAFIVAHNINVVNHGSIVQGMGNGTIKLTGNTNTTTSGSGTTTLEKLDVSITNGYTHTLTSTVNIKNVITLTSGQIVSGGYLVIKSDSINTARLAPITSTASPAISGNVIVERHIAGRRKYRLITSSVTTSPSSVLNAGQEGLSIWGNWQNQGNNGTANTGTLITGGTANDGFDQQTPNVSLYSYDDAARKFIGFSSALGKNTKYTPLKAGVAYYMFVYGDRTNTISTSTPKSTVLKQTGTLLLGDQTYNPSSSIPLSNVTGRYTLLGNPFASPIDWASISKTNVANTYWGWDPNLASTGGYVTVSTIGNTVVISPLTGTTGLNQFIQQGQGFFVKTTASSPSLIIREQDKAPHINSNTFRTGDNSMPLLAVNLHYNNGSSNILADGVVAIFNPLFSNVAGSEDAAKMLGSAESVSIQNAFELLSIDGRQMPTVNDTLFLNLLNLIRPQYTLQIFGKDLPGNVVPYLEDNYLHTSKQLSTIDTNMVTLSVNTTDAASFNSKRFRIVFKPLTVLPLNFTSIKAVRHGNQVLLEWVLADEKGIRFYEIERSSNSIDFTKQHETAVHIAGSNTGYEWIDVKPLFYNYYRVRAIQSDGQFLYSKVVTIKMDLTQSLIKIFPNPVNNNTIQLTMNGVERGTYIVKLVNMQGQEVYTTLLHHNSISENHAISLSRKLASGRYILHLKNDNTSFSEVFIIR